jgi:hypothetical protein
MAAAHLEKSCEMTKKYDSPHSKDIAYICYANLLSSLNQFQKASELYDKGLKIALEIGHDYEGIKVYRDQIFTTLKKLITDAIIKIRFWQSLRTDGIILILVRLKKIQGLNLKIATIICVKPDAVMMEFI